jgi:predicted phage terminase large subunit-like protein
VIGSLPWMNASPGGSSDVVRLKVYLHGNPSSLCPERYPAERLQVIRRAVGEYHFNALYQQRPTPKEGGMFKPGRLEIVAVAPARIVGRVRYWDLASSVSESADWSVGLKMSCSSDGLFYIEDVVRGRWSPFDRDKVILQTAAVDGRGTAIRIEQEPGSSGVSLIASLVRLLAGFAVQPDRVTGDKATRAMPLASQCEAGNVKLVNGPWVKEFLDELASFPFGKNDDQVDGASGAFNALAGMRSPAVIGSIPNPLAGRRWGT